MKTLLKLIIAVGVAGALPAHANTEHHGHGASQASAAQAQAQPWADAEVRKVDRDAGKVTLRHGPLPHLGMPTGMTMVFRVSEPKLLEDLKSGDKIRFLADKVNGAYTVTAVQK